MQIASFREWYSGENTFMHQKKEQRYAKYLLAISQNKLEEQTGISLMLACKIRVVN
uniref:Uncharacterized protein n=1 Tax=Anguilla anguilla TaxID=7936 RepID=A0A0E9X1C0_ANGAN